MKFVIRKGMPTDKRPPTSVYECFDCGHMFADHQHVDPNCPKCGEIEKVYHVN